MVQTNGLLCVNAKSFIKMKVLFRGLLQFGITKINFRVWFKSYFQIFCFEILVWRGASRSYFQRGQKVVPIQEN